jgi:hypothetical protein
MVADVAAAPSPLYEAVPVPAIVVITSKHCVSRRTKNNAVSAINSANISGFQALFPFFSSPSESPIHFQQNQGRFGPKEQLIR